MAGTSSHLPFMTQPLSPSPGLLMVQYIELLLYVNVHVVAQHQFCLFHIYCITEVHLHQSVLLANLTSV